MSHAAEHRRPARRIAVAAIWVLTGVLATIALLRIVCHDASNALTCLNAFTRYIYLPAYVFLIVAVRNRLRWLAMVNLAIVGCHIYWTAHDFIPDRRIATTMTSAAEGKPQRTTVRILFANVWYQNPESNAFLQEIERTNPDVIVLAEFPFSWREPFRDSPIMANYRFGHGYKPWRSEQMIVYSRLPLRAENERPVTDRVVQFIDVAVGDDTLHVVGLHSPRPTYLRNDDYAGFWKELTPLILAAPHPLVVIGDFNATQNSRVYKELRTSGLRSAHEDRGRGYATTWPNGWSLIPPIRIDQAFLSSDVICRDISEGVGVGSDHRPIILDVQIGPNSL